MFKYIEATPEKLNEVWDINIKNHLGDDRWVRWKKQFVTDNELGKCKTFLVLHNDVPIGEGTILFSPDCRAIKQRKWLADNKTTANINGLRIIKEFEGQGHISKMVKMMETYAKSLGYEVMTIGVEEEEKRNRAIYKHWNYDTLIHEEVESGVVVLYYKKQL